MRQSPRWRALGILAAWTAAGAMAMAAPSAPVGLRVRIQSGADTNIVLSWNQVAGATGYFLVAEDHAGNWSQALAGAFTAEPSGTVVVTY